jgi:hypothetical protein
VGVEHQHRDAAVVAEAVLDTGRHQDEGATTGLDGPLAEEEGHLALDM